MLEKLSAAIREGAKLLPDQCVGDFADSYPFPKKTDVLGAAYHALAKDPPPMRWMNSNYQVQTMLTRKTGVKARTKVTHPSSGIRANIFVVMASLNDEGWTREQIADWLESIG